MHGGQLELPVAKPIKHYSLVKAFLTIIVVHHVKLISHIWTAYMSHARSSPFCLL